MAMFMAIPNSDYDKISWIKANNIEEAAEMIQEDLGLTKQDMLDCEYRVFEIPSDKEFKEKETKIISRVSEYTRMFMYDDELYKVIR